MARIIFYEKPSRVTNTRQKTLLAASGHEIETHNLLTEPWSPSSLRPYFGATPVRDWFDSASPRVQSGEIDPDSVTPQEALVMMILDPELIRNPLMRVGDHCEAGFDIGAISQWVGVTSPSQTPGQTRAV